MLISSSVGMFLFHNKGDSSTLGTSLGQETSRFLIYSPPTLDL